VGASVQHAGDSPSIFLVVFIIIFPLKSTDHHKNPGNETKEKTNVQPKSKNPELRRRRGTGLLGVHKGRRVVPTSMAADRGRHGRKGKPGWAVMLTAAR
jgi:hypothetical protein